MPPTLIAFSVPYWLQVAAFPGILFVFCCAMFTWELLRCRWARRQHRASHPEMDDGEFIRRVGFGRAEVEGEAACRIRHAIAKIMHVPPTTLHPSDELGYIASFGFGKMDFAEIAWAIDRALEIRIPMHLWKYFFKGKRCDNFEDLLRFLFDQYYLSPEGTTPSVAALASPVPAPSALPLAGPAPAAPSDPAPTSPSTPPAPAH
jgi:hypothetical protein